MSGSASELPGNRLAIERSPYLLQHARNPVDWWPWGTDAIAEARRLDRPLFLSIGYATCHWCHVMARESFEDPAIGRRLREHFVCVKVDREERPEVDEVCMTACQIFTQLVEGRPSGGWPLSIWLEPRTLAPFFVGTYFPPEPAHGRPSFAQVIAALGSAWRERRAEVEAQGERLLALVEAQLGSRGEPVDIPPSIVREAADRLMAIHDLEHGGFGGAPKFPQACAIELLLEAARDEQAPGSGRTPERVSARATGSPMPMLDAVRRTLVSMARGGIHDQVGGGFHRYAVDREWIVPHFEKMLYDQGQLASLSARASLVLGEPRMPTVASRTCIATLRELGLPGGGLACARDAEAAGREGIGFIWTRESFERAFVEASRADLHPRAVEAFGLDAPANFRDPHHPESPPAWVLVDRTPWSGGSADAEVALRTMRAVLLAARSMGPQPSVDDKVVPSWNGLMIEGLVDTARAILEWTKGPRAAELVDADQDCSMNAATAWMAAARDAASFVLGSMRDQDGGLLRVWRHGAAGVPASLDDYGLMARGLAALAGAESEASASERWIAEALALLDVAEARFADGGGGWYDAPADGLLPVRARSLDDGAMPSGTTAMVGAHLRLADAVDAQGARDAHGAKDTAVRARRHRERAAAAIRAASATLVMNPLASMGLLAEIARLRRAVPGAI